VYIANIASLHKKNKTSEAESTAAELGDAFRKSLANLVGSLIIKIITGTAGDLLDTFIDKIARRVATRIVVRGTVTIQRTVIVPGRSVRVVGAIIARRLISSGSAVVVGRAVGVSGRSV